MSLVPAEWHNEYLGESDPGEVWTLKVEHDCITIGHPFVVTIDAKQDLDSGDGGNVLICLSPKTAREVATALLVYARFADQSNARIEAER